MAVIEIQDGSIQVDAELIAEGLDIAPSTVQAQLREGKIIVRCERGTGEDEGRHRLTFLTATRRFRITVDASGKVIQRSSVRFPDSARAASEQKPG